MITAHIDGLPGVPLPHAFTVADSAMLITCGLWEGRLILERDGAMVEEWMGKNDRNVWTRVNAGSYWLRLTPES